MCCLPERIVQVFQQTRARQQRQLILQSEFTRRMLQTKSTHLLWSRTNKADPVRSALLGKVRFFAQKTVTGMNGLRACMSCNLQDLVGAQIAFASGSAPYAIGFIGFHYMTRESIRVRINRHTFNSDAAQRAANAAGDGAPIRDQYLIKHELF